jgi:acetate---CoA ligase (ADP-forming)
LNPAVEEKSDLKLKEGFPMNIFFNPGSIAAQSIEKLYPDWMPVHNPINIWPAVEKNVKTKINVLKESLRALLSDSAVDAVLLLGVLGNSRVNINVADFVEEMRISGKPVFCSFFGTRELTTI